MRPVAILALLTGLVLGAAAIITVYTFEKDKNGYAEGVCPAPPNGVDSKERQDCFRSYESKSGVDVAWNRILLAAVFLVAGVVLLPFTRTGPWPSSESIEQT